MKNIVVFLVALMATTFSLSEQAFAGGGKGGGKKQSRIEVTNQNPASGRTISVWVLPAGTQAPATVGDARKLFPRRELPALKTETFRAPTGNYFVVAADTLVYQGAADSTPITTQVVAIKNPVVVGATTVKLTTKTVGVAPLFVPEIKP
jgi:hypothetical protein